MFYPYENNHHSAQWTRSNVSQDTGWGEISLLLPGGMKTLKGQESNTNSFASVRLDNKQKYYPIFFACKSYHLAELITSCTF